MLSGTYAEGFGRGRRGRTVQGADRPSRACTWPTAGPSTSPPSGRPGGSGSSTSFKAAGYEIPTPWGHKLKAVPHDPADPYRLDEEISRWNAGYVEASAGRADRRAVHAGPRPARLPGGQGPPGLVNDRDGTVIREVSPGFGDMIDGQGREHHDVLFHVALCTHPVLPGQPGFEPGGTAARRPSVRFMSAAGRITRLQFLASPGGKAMADADDDKKGKKKDAGGPTGDPPIEPDGSAGPGSDAPKVTDVAPTDAPPDVAPAAPEAPEPALDPTLAAPEPADPAGLGQVGFTPTQVEQVKQIFAQLGSPLLPDTSPQNVVERIIVVLHTAANAGASAHAPGGRRRGRGPAPGPVHRERRPRPERHRRRDGRPRAPPRSCTTPPASRPDPGPGHPRPRPRPGAKSEADALAAEWDKIASGPGPPLKAVVAKEKPLAGSFHLSLNPDTGQVIAKAARARLASPRSFWPPAAACTSSRSNSAGPPPAWRPTRRAGAPAQAAPAPRPGDRGHLDDEVRPRSPHDVPAGRSRSAAATRSGGRRTHPRRAGSPERPFHPVRSPPMPVASGQASWATPGCAPCSTAEHRRPLTSTAPMFLPGGPVHQRAPRPATRATPLHRSPPGRPDHGQADRPTGTSPTPSSARPPGPWPPAGRRSPSRPPRPSSWSAGSGPPAT
jgi:hypothetical protein